MRRREAGTLTEKIRASRIALVAFFALVNFLPTRLGAIEVSRTDTQSIGRKIWRNECNGSIAGLTSWNAGENFASLGIGHFIWFPKGAHEPFDESFPKFVGYFSKTGREMPAFVRGACPWNSRAEFEQAANSKMMKELRAFLATTINEQAQFLIFRLDESLGKMLAAAGDQRAKVEREFQRVAASGANGKYALADYVNFKGEGVLESERYRGEGWGLLQVLEAMSDNEDAVRDFSNAARNVLKRRVQNSPADRNESRWLQGWVARINTYSRG